MVLYRTPLVDKAQPIVFTPGVRGYSELNAGCLTPYFQRTLMEISAGANEGSKIVGGQAQGWGSPTGTGSRAAYTTYTAPTISNPPTQAEVQALANATQVVSQHLKSVIDDLKALGIFGP